MKIEYFLNEDGFLKKEALNGGVYAVDLKKEQSEEVIHLYVGEAGCIVKRCGKHLMEFSINPEYFGIKKEYIKDDGLILQFCVKKSLEDKNGRYNGEYKQFELKMIEKLEPLTQNSKNDHMRPIEKKIARVEKAMKEKGFI